MAPKRRAHAVKTLPIQFSQRAVADGWRWRSGLAQRTRDVDADVVDVDDEMAKAVNNIILVTGRDGARL